jgi:hypothetical protein
MRGGAVALVTSLLAACPGDDGDATSTTSSTSSSVPPSCTLPFLGDDTKDPELELFYYGADLADHDLADGGEVHLIEPPQGGRVLFVGVRVINVDPCGVTLTGALRDPGTMQVRFDTRNLNLIDDGTGHGRSVTGDIASYANVPVCHNTWTDLDIYDTPFTLEVTLKDKRQRQTMKTITVVPTCAEPDKEVQCTCICDGDYVLGDACGGGGPGGGGVGGGG